MVQGLFNEPVDRFGKTKFLFIGYYCNIQVRVGFFETCQKIGEFGVATMIINDQQPERTTGIPDQVIERGFDQIRSVINED